MKYVKLMLSQVVVSLGIALVLNASLGVFPISATNLALCGWLNVSYGVANLLSELMMLLYAMYRGERIGVATISSCLLGGFIVDFFTSILPTTWLLAPIGIICLPLGYGLIGSCGLGENASCMFTTALQKQFNKSTKFVRNVMEICFLIVGLLGATSSITWFSVVLSLGFGTVMGTIYKIIGYNPTKIKHSWLIFRK